MRKKQISVQVTKFNKKFSPLIKKIGKKMGLRNKTEKQILRQIYLDTLETPAMSESCGFRTAEHPWLGIEQKEAQGGEAPMSIRIKGGFPWNQLKLLTTPELEFRAHTFAKVCKIPKKEMERLLQLKNDTYKSLEKGGLDAEKEAFTKMLPEFEKDVLQKISKFIID